MRQPLLLLSGVISFTAATLAQTADPGTRVPSLPGASIAPLKWSQLDQKNHFAYIPPDAAADQFKIAIPKDLPVEKAKVTMELVKKLRETCPECSTGGTLGGGGVIIGPNTPSATTVLFGGTSPGGLFVASPEFIQVKKSTYDELKRKADIYDSLIAKQ